MDRRQALAFTGTFALSLFAQGAAAQTYPSRPVTIIVPNAPGGPSDVLARSIGQKLSVRLGQPVVIENRAGAAGIIAAEAVALAKPDGYTVLLSNVDTLSTYPASAGKLRYDAAKDFAPVGLIATSNYILTVRRDLPVKNVQELIELAKRQPDELTYGCVGLGGAGHLTGESFKAMTGTRIRTISYKAPSVLLMDMQAQRIDVGFSPEASAYKDSVPIAKARPMAVLGPARSTLFPDVPTAEEVGLKGLDLRLWYGLNAPGATPQPVLDRLNAELRAILASPEMKVELATSGLSTQMLTSQQFGVFLEEQRQIWAPIVKAVGTKAE